MMGIRVRWIRLFLRLQDPDPLVRNTDLDSDPGADPSMIKQK